MPEARTRRRLAVHNPTGVLVLEHSHGAWPVTAVDPAARELLGLLPAQDPVDAHNSIEFVGLPASFSDWLSDSFAAVGTTQLARVVRTDDTRREVHVVLTVAALEDERATVWIRRMPAAEVVQIAALASPVAVVLVDEGLRIRWANPATVRSFGQPLGRIAGRTLYDFSSAAEQRRDVHEQLFRGEIEEYAVAETPVQVEGGPVRYMMVRFQVLRNPDGSVDCLAVYGEDVTSRVAFENELKARYTRYRALTGHVNDLVTLCDASGRIIMPSAAIERVLGYSAEERVGRPALEVVHPDDRERAIRALQSLVQTPEVDRSPVLEVRLRHKNGSWLDVEYTATNMLEDPDVRAVLLVGRVVTQRKQFEQRLRRAKDALELAVDGVHVSFWDYDVATATVSAAAILTLEADESVGNDLQHRAAPSWSIERLHPADQPLFERAVQAIVDGREQLVDTEVRVLEPGGDVTWLLLRGRLAVMQSGSIARLTGMSVDVTNLKSAQAAAARDRLKLQLALTAAHIGTWEYSISEARIALDAIGAQVARRGRQDIELSRDSWLSHVHAEDRGTLRDWVASFVTGSATVQDCEYRLVGDDGVPRRLLMRGYVSDSFAPGQPSRLAGIVLEIDELRAAELRLRETENKLATALWAAQVGYWTVDLVQNRAEMSPEYFELTGIDPADWHADRHPWDSRIHPDDWARHVRWRQKCLQGKSLHYESEYRLRTPTGWVWVSDRGRIVGRDAHGRPTLLAGTTVNVSERKELEQQLISAASLEQRRLSQDLHDGLGQELAGIAYLLSGLSNRIRREYGAVAGDVDQLSALMRQAVASARSIAHGLLPAGLVSGGLRQAIRELCAGTATTFGVRVDCETDDWEPGLVADDAAQHIYRIVQEALNNARRHGRASAIRVVVRVAERTMTVSVTDNGRGLPAELPPDAGFGLRIMANRAHSMGGELDVSALPAGGTEVRLMCPLIVVGEERTAVPLLAPETGVVS